MSKDELIKLFEDAGYKNVEIIGDRLLFTTGEDVINLSMQEAINFIGGYKNEKFQNCINN